MEAVRYEDLAEILGVPAGTMRSRHRARLKLRHILVQKE